MPSLQTRRRPRASTTVQSQAPSWAPPARERPTRPPGTARTPRSAAQQGTQRTTRRQVGGPAGRRGEGSSAARRRRRGGRGSGRNTAGLLSVWMAGTAVFLWFCGVVLVMNFLSGSVGAATVIPMVIVGLGLYACPIAGLIAGLIGLQRQPKQMATIGVVANVAILAIYQILRAL